MPIAISVCSFYFFKPVPQEDLELLGEEIENQASKRAILGILIFGTEGLNVTISGSELQVQDFVSWVQVHFQIPSLDIKWSSHSEHPFKKLKVKLRPEIVTLGKPDVLPFTDKSTHLPPSAWQEALQSKDAVILDTRNWYESDLGKFKDALIPNIDSFHEFPEYLQTSGLKKDRTYLIYCTGGIRCEKAAVEMRRQGFENVYQLDGGILRYLEIFPNRDFEGDCFVFDERLAVDQELKPAGRYRLCYECGDVQIIGQPCTTCTARALETTAHV